MDNIEVFNDSLRRIRENQVLLEQTEAAASNTCIVNEGFQSQKSPYFSDIHVCFEENMTLISAYLSASILTVTSS